MRSSSHFTSLVTVAWPFPVAFPVIFPLPGFAASKATFGYHFFLAAETLRNSVSDRSNTTWVTMAAGK